MTPSPSLLRAGSGSEESPHAYRLITYAKIKSMKVKLTHRFDRLSATPEHTSYRMHRKQVVWQVILPVLLAALLLVGLIVLISLSTFRGGGDAGRWAAISTIWIVIPVLGAGLVLLILLIAVNYLIARLVQITPAYTGIAQDYVFRGAAIVMRVTKAIVKPVFFLDNLVANIKAFMERR